MKRRRGRIEIPSTSYRRPWRNSLRISSCAPMKRAGFASCRIRRTPRPWCRPRRRWPRRKGSSLPSIPASFPSSLNKFRIPWPNLPSKAKLPSKYRRKFLIFSSPGKSMPRRTRHLRTHLPAALSVCPSLLVSSLGSPRQLSPTPRTRCCRRLIKEAPAATDPCSAAWGTSSAKPVSGSSAPRVSALVVS